MEPISEAVRRAVEASFPPDDWPAVLAALGRVRYWAEDTRPAVVVLANGNLARLRRLVALAGDPRDVLLLLEEPPAGVSQIDLARRYRRLGLKVPEALAQYARPRRRKAPPRRKGRK